jgi:hypothetical protein
MSSLIRQYIREQIIREIGEGSSSPYSYSFTSEIKKSYGIDYIYKFKLDDQPGYVGKIKFTHSDSDDEGEYELEIDFDVLSPEQEYMDDESYEATNFGLKTMFRIMSTIIDVVKKDLTNRIKNPITHLLIMTISDKASRLIKTSNTGNEQRIRLYDSFIKNQIDISNVEPYHGDRGRKYELKNPIYPKNSESPI